jgi:hypothetical protein
MKLTKQNIMEILEIGLVITVSLSLFIYGIGKPLQFLGATNVQKNVSELTGQELMWAFYGYSKTYAIIVGIFEILGAVLLLFRKTRILGGLIITTILFNVILQDVFYGVNVGALIAAIIYQSMVFIIFLLNKKLIINTIQFFIRQYPPSVKTENRRLTIVLAIVLAVLFKIIESFLTH